MATAIGSGVTESNDCADVSEGYSAMEMETAGKEAYFQRSQK